MEPVQAEHLLGRGREERAYCFGERDHVRAERVHGPRLRGRELARRP
jgi:hypothetical protein